MKRHRGTLLASAILLSTLPLFGCSNPLEGGSDPSGSYIRVVSVVPGIVEQDIWLTLCDPGPPPVFEPGITQGRTVVTLRNDPAPNSPPDNPTNSNVTMSLYRVQYTGINRAVTIPAFAVPGQSVGIVKNGTGTMSLLVMPYSVLDYIRTNYPTVGVSESLQLRATVTIEGKDAFDVDVSVQVEVTVTVEDYNRCA